MRRSRFLRPPRPPWALDSKEVTPEAVLLTDRAAKLLQTRRLIWKVDLLLVGVLVVANVSLKLLTPAFPAAQYLGIEIGVLEAVTSIISRRMTRQERQLKSEYLERVGSGS